MPTPDSKIGGQSQISLDMKVGSLPSSKAHIGVSFNNLECHGSISLIQYQRTFFNYALSSLESIWSRLNPRIDKKVAILNGIEGLIQPGQMLLVLGRPGSGCSTFLKALAGDTRGLELSADTHINYQGVPYQWFHNHFQGERVYLAELDVHLPELTLGQTLNFAASTREKHPGKNHGRDISRLFNLHKAFDTQIGDTMIPGISGGEKRRTSIAETYIGGAQLQCWDNSTRGLDSLTASHIVNLLRTLTLERNSTVAMSLYQASDSMYRTFDHVLLLYEGRQIYYGPVHSAEDYFIKLGFVKPTRATTADFLTSLTSPAERVVLSGYENRVPRLPDEFANVWRLSQEARSLRSRIALFNAEHPFDNQQSGKGLNVSDAQNMTRSSTYPLSVYRQVSICTFRAFQRIQKSIATDISAVVANTILGIIVGSVFYDLKETTENLQPRAVVIFLALMINGLAPAFEVVTMWAQRPIVEKHHRYAFYHPFTDRLASIICDLPTKLLVCTGIHLPIYFLVNLRRNVGSFFVYWIFMFINMVTMSMLFRMVGSISKTREATMTPVAMAISLAIIYTGFIVPSAYMKPWLGWFWRVNPLAYAYESLMINELNNRVFPCSTMIPAGPSYATIGVEHQTCTVVGSEIGQKVVSGRAYLALKYGYIPSHLWRNFGILLSMMTAFCVAHLLASQYIKAKTSCGEVLQFLRGQSPNQRAPSLDIESGSLSKASPQGRQGSAHGSSPTRDEDAGNDVLSHSSSAPLIWSNLSYDIKKNSNTHRILKDITGWVQPGTVTALMGVTGAGKTSLLNALAGRVTTGTVMGQIYTGQQLRDATFRRKVGYAQQEDVHLATSTVREALQFSALLRQPSSLPDQEKLSYVEQVLDILGMQWYADAIVGLPGEGLNIEQRKLLTIAVEMAARPELLLFLDEPTSGLDSQTAWSICKTLRKLADNGQSILCTIHQPSFQLFCMFDSLLLLDRTGTTLYFGEIGKDASTLIEYFETNSGTTCPVGGNPAEWILEVTGNRSDVTTPHDSGESLWYQKWKYSPQGREVSDRLASMEAAVAQNTPQHLMEGGQDEYAVSIARQLIIVSQRIFRDQWRDPVYLYSKFALSICLALVNGFSFYNSPLDIQGVTNLLFSIFLITQLFSCIDQLVIPRFIAARTIFEARERDSKSYSWVVFVAANILVELFWQTVIAIPIFAVWYYPTGLQHNGDLYLTTATRGALSFLLIWLFTLWASTLSQIFAAAFEHGEMAMQIATLFYWLALVFCGILVSPNNLPHFWVFMYRVSPLTYLLEGLAVVGLANANITCSSVEILQVPLPQNSAPKTCGEYLAPFAALGGGRVSNPDANSQCQYCPISNINPVLGDYGMRPDHAWRNVGLLLVYVVIDVGIIFLIYWLVRVPKSVWKRHTQNK